MKKNWIFTLLFLIVSALGLQTVSAQFNIRIPKLPKIKKDNPPPANVPPTDTPAAKEPSNNNPPNDRQTEQPKQSQPPAQDTDKYINNAAFNYHLDEIKKWTKMVNEYDTDKLYLVPDSNNNYLLYAVSPQAREEWMKSFGVLDIRQTPNNRLDAALDTLNAAAVKKLPLYLPETKNYPIKNVAEESLMKSKINRLADHKILYIGIEQARWLIEKNDLGIPTARYKHGMVWVRVARHDYPYCWVYYINIVQDYAGGGTYGASYGNFVKDELFGCPAAK